VDVRRDQRPDRERMLSVDGLVARDASQATPAAK
jgi:hypothetical protein